MRKPKSGVGESVVSFAVEGPYNVKTFLAKNGHGTLSPKAGKKMSVGAKRKWDDPQAKPEGLAKISKRNGLALTNPNMPLKALLEGATRFPWFVEQNPALELFMLENPDNKTKINVALADGWRVVGVRALTPATRRIIAVEAASRVLPFYEKAHPQEHSQSRALEVARQFAHGEADASKLLLALQESARSAKRDTQSNSEVADAVQFAVIWTSTGYDSQCAEWALEKAAEAAGSAASEASGSDSHELSEEAQNNEKIWQANLIRRHYAKEHPDYKKPDTVGAMSNTDSYLPGPEFDYAPKSRAPRSGRTVVGDVSPLKQDVQDSINRAYAYWTGSSSVGARPPKRVKSQSKAAKAERRAYLNTLSQIKDYKRDHPTTILQLGILRDWQNDRRLTSLVQEVLGETPGYYNIMQLADEASPEEFDHWVNWYLHAHGDVERLQKKHNLIRRNRGERPLPFSVVAAVVAVLSPNNSWLNNLAAADYILTHQTGEGSTAYRANAAKALSMIDSWMTDQVRGPKVTVFYESLNKPWKMGENVVLDGHMINIWRGNKAGVKNIRQPGTEERAQMLRDFRQAALDLGITPQSVQALTWYIWRYTTDAPKPSLKVLKMARAEFIADLEQRKKDRQTAEKYLQEESEFFHGDGELEDFVKGRAPSVKPRKMKLKKQTLMSLPSGNQIHVSR
jgi:hypothetical protein